MENVCRFIPISYSGDTFHIINFVLETEKEKLRHPEESAGYRLFYVIRGAGKLKTGSAVTPLSEHDLFLTFPGKDFSIEGSDDLACMYINFLGARATVIIDSLGITMTHYHFSSLPELRALWEKAIHNFPNSLDLISESVLLYTFAMLAERLKRESNSLLSPGASEMIRQIKKYVDENYADPVLSLESVAEHFSYNKTYLSSIFKKQLKTGFSNYLNIIRCRHACRLLEKEFTTTQDIAFRCGYNDALYFSKVFRQKMGISPRDYRASLKAKKDEV